MTLLIMADLGGFEGRKQVGLAARCSPCTSTVLPAWPLSLSSAPTPTLTPSIQSVSYSVLSYYFLHLFQDRILDLSRSKTKRELLLPLQPSVLLSCASPLCPEMVRVPQRRMMFGTVTRLALTMKRWPMWATVRRTPTSTPTLSQGLLGPEGVLRMPQNTWLLPQVCH